MQWLGLWLACWAPGVDDAEPTAAEMVEVDWVEESVSAAADGWPQDHRGAFLRRVAPLAVASGSEHCIPPSVTVSQAVLESDWGRSALARSQRNLFGMKAHDDEPHLAPPDEPGVNQRYRYFESWWEAVRAHDQRLATHSHYTPTLEHRREAHDFVHALAPKYASDPAYAHRLLEVANLYELDALDEEALERADEAGHCG